MTFPKYAKFGLSVSILALLYEVYWFFAGPQTTVSRFFIVLGVLAAITGILYFTHELRQKD